MDPLNLGNKYLLAALWNNRSLPVPLFRMYLWGDLMKCCITVLWEVVSTSTSTVFLWIFFFFFYDGSFHFDIFKKDKWSLRKKTPGGGWWGLLYNRNFFFCLLTVQAGEAAAAAATRVLFVIYYLPTFCDLFSCFHVFGTNSGILTFLWNI